MKSIFSFLISFCVGGICLGAVYILLPEGAFKKPLKYLIGVCFVCVIAASLPKSIDINISSDILNIEEYTENANENAAELTIKTALEKAGINYSNIYFTYQKNNEGKIDFINVEIHTSCNREAVINAIKSEKIKVSVINE